MAIMSSQTRFNALILELQVLIPLVWFQKGLRFRENTFNLTQFDSSQNCAPCMDIIIIRQTRIGCIRSTGVSSP